MPVLWDLEVGSFNPGQQVEKCIELAVRYGLMAIIVEAVSYQATLCFWMEEAKRRYGLAGLRILEIYPGMNQKNARIINMLKQLTAPSRILLVHPQVKSQVTHQIVHFNPMNFRNADDILDLMGYFYPAISQFGLMLLRPFEVSHEVHASFSDTLEMSF